MIIFVSHLNVLAPEGRMCKGLWIAFEVKLVRIHTYLPNETLTPNLIN